MKSEHIPLIVALLAAAASLGGVLLNQRGALTLERQKWNQAQLDATDKLISEFVRDYEAISHEGGWLIWKAGASRSGLDKSDLDAYDIQARKHMPVLAAHLSLISARSEPVAMELRPIRSDLALLDNCIGKAGVTFRENKAKGLDAIRSCEHLSFRIGERASAAFSGATSAARGAKPSAPPASGPSK